MSLTFTGGLGKLIFALHTKSKYMISFLITAVLFPLCVSHGAADNGDVQEPLMLILTESWDVGLVEEGKIYETQIRLKNVGAGQLFVKGARSSCECLFAHVLKPTAEPGEEAAIQVKLLAKGLKKRFKKFIYIQSNDENQPVVQIPVTGQLKNASKSDAVTILFFYSQEALNWKDVAKLLSRLNNKHAKKIRVEKYDIGDVENYTRLYKLERELDVEKFAPLEVFVDDVYLCGFEEIRDNLESLAFALLEGDESYSVEQTETPTEDTNIKLLFFYSPGCKQCRQIKDVLLESLAKKYPIVVKKYDISAMNNYEFLVRLEEQYGVTENSEMSLFVGDEYLLGRKAIARRAESIVQGALSKKYTKNLTRSEGANRFVTPHSGSSAIVRRFRSFSVATIAAAGLLDGINPCAFTTIVFFISLLTHRGKSKREVLTVGFFFTIAVFIAYLLLGLGVLKALQTLNLYVSLSTTLYYITAVAAIVFGGYSAYDGLTYLKTRDSTSIKLQLPAKIKRKIHAVMSKNLRIHNLAIAALLIGFIVSALESVCTGQIYLPTIAFMTKDADLQLYAFSYLILYNLLFILPLAFVFALAYCGVRSERLAKFSEKNVAITKFLTAMLFLGLGISLLLTN